MQVDTYKCDVCGALKKEANHWFIATTGMVGYARFIIVPWGGSLPGSADDFLHLCGMGCAIKAMQSEMTRGESASSV